MLAVFQRTPRPITEPGKGNYWYLDFTKGDGNKRPRKRNKKPTKAQLKAAQEAREARESSYTSSPQTTEMELDELDEIEHASYRLGLAAASSSNLPDHMIASSSTQVAGPSYLTNNTQIFEDEEDEDVHRLPAIDPPLL